MIAALRSTLLAASRPVPIEAEAALPRAERLIRRLGRIALPLGLGAAMSWSQAPYSAFWIMAPVLAALAILFVRAPTTARAAWLGWLFGVGYFLPGLLWIGRAFLVEADRFAWMEPFAVTLLPMGLSLFWAAGFALAHQLWRRTTPAGAPLDPAAGALALAGIWALAELARGHWLTGFPWGLFSFSWIETPTAQAAAWIGSYGLNALTIAAGLSLGVAFLVSGRRRALLLTLAIAPLAGLTLAGWARLPDAPPTATSDAPLIRLVQPNVPQTEKWVPEFQRRNFDRLINLSFAPGPAPQLVIWPETATPFLVDEQPALRRQVMSDLPQGALLVVGSQRRVDDQQGRRWYNSLFVIGQGGAIEAAYDKHHLVPFGEYLPFQQTLEALGINHLAGRLGGFTQGPGPETLNVAGAPSFAPLICYEAIFPQDMPGLSNRPALLLQITNDAWFGESSGPYQHLVQARWRAIEQGLPLVRSANTGVSAGIDAYGRIVTQIPLGAMDSTDLRLPQALEATGYVLLGETVSLLVSFLLMILSTSLRFVVQPY